ncbi:MAG: DUF4230 domain-containing protein [Sphingobium sp.]|nr:DUF4230 domain-containing protein [Sphingobium sp.]MCP5400224.1 DUF4230 domain-containing protein [Sphingomonas sp.]
MKKLIVPIALGVVMFALAFGGAFYFYNSSQAQNEENVQEAISEGLDILHGEKRLPVYLGHYVSVISTDLAPVVVPVAKEENKANESEGDAKSAEAAEAKPQEAAGSRRSLVSIPGTVRYELDVKAIKSKDVVWDEEEETLSIKLPPLALAGPDLDFANVIEYAANGNAAKLANAEKRLDKANRDVAMVNIMRQARSDAEMKAARDTARRAIERTFSIPLRTSGMHATVNARFEDEAEGEDE